MRYEADGSLSWELIDEEKPLLPSVQTWSEEKAKIEELEVDEE